MILTLAFILGIRSQSTELGTLCSQMPGMPGCTLLNKCLSDAGSLPSSYCSNSSLLADICMYDMPKMTSCLNFTCNDCNPLPNLPTSKTATRAIFSICSEMNMDGCNNCRISGNTSTYASCDLLGTFGQLCRAMPEMSQCDAWNQMCSASPGIKLCDSNTKDSAPVMKMYFHTGIKDYILFENAVPGNNGTYALALILVFLFAMLYDGYQILHFKVLDIIGNQSDNTTKTQIKTAFLRGFTRLIGAWWTYSLMLIAMTFNVGLFLSVIIGLAFGSAIFGPFLSKLEEKRLVSFQGEELCC